MKISFSTIICHEWSLDQVADAFERHGYDGVELYSIDSEKVTPDYLESRLEDVKSFQQRVPIPAIHSWQMLSFRDDDEQQERLRIVSKGVELASQLEIPLVKIFADFPPVDTSINEAYDTLAGSLTPVVKRAGELGVTIMLETHDGTPEGIDVQRLLVRVEDTALGAVWDTFHPHRRGEDVRTTDELIGDRTVHVHLKDNARFPGRYQTRFKGWVPVRPGEGEVPNREAVALLHARGYDGYLSVDAERQWEPMGTYDEPEEIMSQYAEAMREYIAAAKV